MSTSLVDNEEFNRDMKAALGGLINDLKGLFPEVSFACTLTIAHAVGDTVHGREISVHHETATVDELSSFATGLFRAADALAHEIIGKGQRSKGLH